jgi:serine/threonine-protein kinase
MALREGSLADRGKSVRIAGFELLSKIGEGGMGAVYRARQVSMDRLVAVKVLPRRLANDDEFIQRFIREARAAGKLNHINIVQGLDVGHKNGRYYFAMEYVDGKTIKELFKDRDGVFAPREAVQILLQVARALDHAHRHGIVHRDVKPDNILVAGDGVAKLADLGLARNYGADVTVTQAGMTLGTPQYMSPEQARGDTEMDTRSDIYSLGATLYHMVVGEPPFTGATPLSVVSKHITDDLPPPQVRRPGLDPKLCRIIETMMAKDKADRYQTPAELAADLDAFLQGETPTLGARGEATRPAPGRGAGKRPRGLAVAGVAAGLLLAVAVVAALWPRGETPPAGPAPGPKPPVAPPDPGPGPKGTATPAVREDPARDAFRAAMAYAKEHPDDRHGILERLAGVAAAHPGTSWAAKARAEETHVRRAAERAASTALSAVEPKAREMVRAHRYAGAFRLYGDFLTARKGLASSATLKRAEAGQEGVVAAARTEIAVRVRRARELATKGDFKAARAELDEVERLDVPGSLRLKGAVELARRRLDDLEREAGERRGALKDEFLAALERVRGLTAERKYGEAKSACDAVLADKKFEALDAKARAEMRRVMKLEKRHVGLLAGVPKLLEDGRARLSGMFFKIGTVSTVSAGKLRVRTPKGAEAGFAIDGLAFGELHRLCARARAATSSSDTLTCVALLLMEGNREDGERELVRAETLRGVDAEMTAYYHARLKGADGGEEPYEPFLRNGLLAGGVQRHGIGRMRIDGDVLVLEALAPGRRRGKAVTRAVDREASYAFTVDVHHDQGRAVLIPFAAFGRDMVWALTRGGFRRGGSFVAGLELHTRRPSPVRPGAWHTVTVRVAKGTAKGYLDGEPMWSVDARAAKRMRADRFSEFPVTGVGVAVGDGQASFRNPRLKTLP